MEILLNITNIFRALLTQQKLIDIADFVMISLQIFVKHITKFTLVTVEKLLRIGHNYLIKLLLNVTVH